MILQLPNPFFVVTPLGEGLAQIVIDYGISNNLMFVVELCDTRQFKCFDSNDVFAVENPTYGLKRPEKVKATYE